MIITLPKFFNKFKAYFIPVKKPKFFLDKKDLIDNAVYYGTGIEETHLAKWSKQKDKFVSLADPDFSSKDRILEYNYPSKKGLKYIFYPIKKIT